MAKGRVGVIAVFFLLASSATAAEKPQWQKGLSDRELAMQRWFYSLTVENDRSARPWAEWFDDGKQLEVTSMRYQLAFCGYGCVAMAGRTPAYREVISKQLRDICERMMDVRIWYYVTKYWDYGNRPPDPCQYENVMYTGHLTQLMCLYELMTGDARYAKEGWDFVWRDGRSVHYDLEKAIRRLYVQSAKNFNAGIPCEPGLVFADCNSHSSNSYMLFDLLHGTGYSQANKKWFAWMSKNFRNRIPATREFLYVVYSLKDKSFIPIGDVGADAWALGWGYPWYPDTRFTAQGWRHIVKHAKWFTPADDQMYAKNNPVVGCCGGSTPGVANSFLPLVGVQAEGADSPVAHKVLNWLEANFGRSVDTDGDGHAESYYYHTCNAHRIPATGNIAAALATDGDSMRRLYRTRRDHILKAPTLDHVDYPNVYVRAAEYAAPTLHIVVLKARPGFRGTTELVCSRIKGNVKVARDGKAYAKFKKAGDKVIIETDVDTEHVFDITLQAP